MVMPQNFPFPQRDQPLLLPVDMREWLPADDLVFIVLDAVAALDLGVFRRRYRADGYGRAAFDPEMMVALLLYAYCQRERSSRVIEKWCVRDVAYRLIAGGLCPRSRHYRAVPGLLVGQPTLRRTMKLAVLAALEQRTALRYTMPGMTAGETSSYVAHHLKLAGRADKLFTEDALNLIHTTARGYPRAVNNLALQSLVAAFATGKNLVDEPAARSAVTEVID
jgi:hypothetical protein